MSQKCSECGRESPIGKPFEHYVGCDHWSQSGSGQTQALRDYLNGPFAQQPTSHGAGVSE